MRNRVEQRDLYKTKGEGGGPYTPLLREKSTSLAGTSQGKKYKAISCGVSAEKKGPRTSSKTSGQIGGEQSVLALCIAGEDLAPEFFLISIGKWR